MTPSEGAGDAHEFPRVFVRHETIRFAHCDPAGIAFFARLDELLNAVFEDWCAECGLPFASSMRPGGHGFPLVHANVDYHRPLRLGDRVRIVQTVTDVGRTSLTVGIVMELDGTPALSATHVRVTTSYDTGAAVPLPAALRERLATTIPEAAR